MQHKDVHEEEKILRQKYFNLLQRLRADKTRTEAEIHEKKDIIAKKYKTGLRDVGGAKMQDRLKYRKLPMDGDVKKGSESFLRFCSSCHAVNYKKMNENLTGPFLGNIYGRIVGSQLNYKYSVNLDRRFYRWNRETLYNFILDPSEYMTDGKCQIPIEARTPSVSADIVEFLKKMSVEVEKNVTLRQQQKIDPRSD